MKKEFFKDLIRALIISYSQGKMGILLQQFNQCSEMIDNIYSTLLISESLEDLETYMKSPTPIDNNQEAVKLLREQVEAVSVIMEHIKSRFLKEVVPESLNWISPDDYTGSIQTEFSKSDFGHKKRRPKIDDLDYEDYDAVFEAFDKFMEAKRYLYDPTYDISDDEKLINEKAAKVIEKVRYPIAAYFISAFHTEKAQDVLEFLDVVIDQNKFKDFITSVMSVINENKEEGHSEKEVLAGLIEDSAFRGRIYKVGMKIKSDIMADISPKMGEFLEGLRQLANVDENFEPIVKPDEEDNSEDLSDFIT